MIAVTGNYTYPEQTPSRAAPGAGNSAAASRRRGPHGRPHTTNSSNVNVRKPVGDGPRENRVGDPLAVFDGVLVDVRLDLDLE